MITPVQDQPILFREPSAPDFCCPESDWNHQFFNNDSVPFQFLLGKTDDAANEVSNPNFTDGSTNWNNAGVAFNIGSSGAWLQDDGSYVEQTGLVNVSLNEWVELKVDVGIIGPDMSGARIRITGFQQVIDFFANTGSFSFYVQGDGSESIKIEAIETYSSALIYIKGVDIYQITLPTIETINSDGTTITSISDGAYSPPYFSVLFQIGADEVTAGCFRFKVTRGDIIFESELIQVIPANNCDLLIGGCSQNTLYSPEEPLYFRTKGKVLADQVPVYERFTTRKNSGMHRLNYARKSKVFTLTIERAPEHVRDYVYSLPLFSVVGIKIGSGVQRNFFVYEEPDPPEFTTGDDDLARVTMRLMYKQELSETIFEGECNFILPPKALGKRSEGIAYRVAPDTAIRVP